MMELKFISSFLERSVSQLLKTKKGHISLLQSKCSRGYADQSRIEYWESFVRNEDFSESNKASNKRRFDHAPRKNFIGNNRTNFNRNNLNNDDFHMPRYNRHRQDHRNDFSNDDFDMPRYNRHGQNHRQRFSHRQNSQQFDNTNFNALSKPNWEQMNLIPFEKNFYEATISEEKQSTEDVAKYREHHNIILNGKDCPNPVLSFADCNFQPSIKDKLLDMEYESPTPIQAQGWPIVLSGRDLVGIAQTGSGKTLGYVLPALIHIGAQERPSGDEGPIALILAPTRELVQQIYSVAKEFGRLMNIGIACAYGGQSKLVQSRQFRSSPSICVATPGRLSDFMSFEEVKMNRLTYLVVDEADRMLDMGFEPQIRSIIDHIRPDRQTVMWSATWPNDVRQLARNYMTNYVQLNIGSTDLRANPDIIQTVKVVEFQEKQQRFLSLIKEEVANKDSKILVFAQTKRIVDAIARNLSSGGIRASGIHGDYSQAARDRVLYDFKHNSIRVLVATDVASRGLDVNDISLVVNYDFPNTVEDYVHRIGRTGRAGKSGRSYSFFTFDNAGLAKDLIKVLDDSNQEICDDLYKMIPSRKRRGNNLH